MSLSFDVHPHPSPASAEERAVVLAAPGFGQHFTDHMAVATWTVEGGWSDAKVVPYGVEQFAPASAVFHYAQEVFEGLKAYRHADDSVWLFRPEANAQRMIDSAERLALPPLPVEDFIASIEAVVKADAAWVPTGGGEDSLYIRPFTIAHEDFLGVRAAHTARYYCIASPSGPYFSSGVEPVDFWVSRRFTRAAAGGTGSAKCGGNYAASLAGQEEAYAHGCPQVLFLDAAEFRYVEEFGGMNCFFVTGDGQLHTPALSGSILPGVTRRSILELARDKGLEPVEERIEVDDMLARIRSGEIVEAFACGTAAVVASVRAFKDGDEEYVVGDGTSGPHSMEIRKTLLDIQYGRIEDTHGWMHKVC
ncbi:branched chain amino acid aminotransferase apoenzyme [Raineyella antarctica]|uniref:Branched-chain-amino-acid aminotransferase n=1 Tax=Raineyella antarctica TaxID=1577474 RepID=A0A1G6GTV6_9ACTN|nr:branched-chain amino acid aminotransferase [Raineyella antarctica]SDB84566.1 branched chain amino acid aminotransferase apoenzyme [Raineyella antarctica]